MDELKPCPCGFDAKLVYESGESYGLHNGVKYTSVKCSSCSFSAGDTDDWNTRADGWISVGDEIKPQINRGRVKVIVFSSACKTTDIGIYDLETNSFSCHSVWKVTHWMPLPPPPKAVK